ncbi:MAG: starch-binding protein [Ruminococcus sp.]
MRFRGFKKFISVVLAVMMIVSTVICGAVATDAATYEVGDIITYQFIVNTECKIQAFEGVVYFPSEKLSVVPQIDDDEIECEAIVYGNSKGNYAAHATGDMMKFQASSANNVYNFTTDATMINVKFLVNDADFSPTEIYAELTNIYDKDHNAYNGNNPYSYKNVIDDKVISGGTVDLDNGTSEETTAPTEATEATTESTESTEATVESTEPTTESTEPVDRTTVYFVNSGNWTVVNAYVWTGSDNNTWPGTAMTATGDKAGNGADIYSFEFDSKYTNIIFTNKNTGSVQTDTLTPQNGKYYDFNTNRWYDDPAEIAGDVCTLAGEMNGWSTSKTPFVDGSVSVDLEADKTYQFKIVVNGDWYGNSGTMTSDNCTGWTFKSDNESNCKITTTIAGTYTFNFDLSTKKLSVVYPKPAETTYTVKFNYVTEDGQQILTKTISTAETDVQAIVKNVMPNIENKMYSYTLGECIAEGTTITANLNETEKLYTVTVDGAIMETQFGYKEKATVTLKDGSEYTFYVTGDVEITSDDPKVAAALSLDAVTVTDTKVSMDLLATANVEDFARMGVAFATSEKSVEEITTAVTNVATGTAAFDGIAVHNSTVNAPNESGSYQFVYAPYVSKDKSDRIFYFYTFAVDADGNVSVSSVVSVDLTNAYV